MTPVGTCEVCARLIRLTQAGTTKRHDTAGIVVRARFGKRRKRCPGSGRLPRRVEA